MAAPLIAIVGETASGKSALALQIAQRFNGEIICADSRTVYQGMDIGTAKPSSEERAGIPHYGLDVIKPDQRFSAAQFKQLANEAVADIAGRGKLPVMVGGTGLYIDSVLFDYDFQPEASERDPQNPRHLKPTNHPSEDKYMRANTLVLGINVPLETLRLRVMDRVQAMLDAGLEQEARGLSIRYGWDVEALTGVGYREFKAQFEGSQTAEETTSLIATHTMQYAKRQRTWFRRNKYIQWVSTPEEALVLAEQFLAKAPSV